jgi:hypothetical protein
MAVPAALYGLASHNNSHGLQYANNAVEETTGWVQKLQAYAVRLPCIAVFIRHQYLDDLL